MLVTVDDIGNSELYPEIITQITRGTTLVATLAISEAEDLVKSYMNRFDLTAIFGDDTTSPVTAPTVSAPAIKRIIKTIATWYLVKRANPNVNTELFYDDYKVAVDWLKALQKGDVNPALPYALDNPATADDESNSVVAWQSNPKRINSF
jgi:hypothetical protein